MEFNLLAEAKTDGFWVHHDSNSKGGQYNGPCVKCGGTDRLRIQPCEGEYGWFICAQCGFKGSGIDWLMEVRGWQKNKALQYVGWKPKDTSGVRMLVPRHVLVGKEDPTHQAPPEKWQTQAKAFVQHCTGILWGDLGRPALDYLRLRGLKDETIQAARMGYNPTKMKQTGAKWGRKKDGELCQGIVIPWFAGDEIWRITIRDETVLEKAKDGRYKQVAGGSNGLYHAQALEEDMPLVLTEGEIDALSILQECGEYVAVCATGSKGGSRIAQWIVALAQKDLVLIAFDADQAGDTAAQWWIDRLENAHRLRPWWEDANRMLQDDIDLLNEWVLPNLDRIANLLTKTSGGDLPIPDEKCHSCQRPFPNFEGWDPELIPPDVMSYDPTNGNAYCQQCRPDLFEEVPATSVSETYLTMPEQVQALAEQLEANTTYVLDLETTGLNPRKDKIITIALGTPGNVSTIDVRGFYDASEAIQGQWKDALQRLLHRDDITWAGHNIKFDWSFLAVHFDVRLQNVYDTMLVEKLIHNGEKVSASLLNTASRYGIGVTKEARNWFIALDTREEWNKPLPMEQMAYIIQDIEVPHLVIEKQQESIGLFDLGRVIALENAALPAVAALEVHGIVVDVERWKGILATKLARKEVLEAELTQVLGSALADRAEADTEGRMFSVRPTIAVNLASHTQVIQALSALGISVESTKSEALEDAAPLHPCIQQLLEWKKLDKFVGTFGLKLLEKVESDGRIHATFDQSGARSGRFTCSTPNLQQIPKPKDDDSNLRRCFIAPTDHQLLVADLSNIELRIIADLSKDPTMLRLFAEGKDLHSETARMMFGLGPDIDPKTHLIHGMKARDVAKTINFGIAYGQSARGLSVSLGTSREEAQKLLDTHLATYRGLATYLEQSSKRSVARGYTTTLLGRRRTFSKKELGTYSATNIAKNHPIQGLCADILKRALALLDERLPQDVHIVLTVHDEIVLEAPTDLVETAENALKTCMLEACREFLKKVMIPEIDVLVASHWVKG